MKYRSTIRQVIELVARHGRAEVHWHPVSGGPTVRTGLHRWKPGAEFPPEHLIGVYTEAPHPQQLVADIEAYLESRA